MNHNINMKNFIPKSEQIKVQLLKSFGEEKNSTQENDNEKNNNQESVKKSFLTIKGLHFIRKSKNK